MNEIRKQLMKEIRECKKGCGVKIGVPLIRKFKPCGYNNREYFCEGCVYKLNILKMKLRYYNLGEKSK